MVKKEYIARDAATNAIMGEPPDAHYPSWYAGTIEKIPAADVVEVVRCKDCAVPHNKWTGCPNLNGLIPPPDFFCARGERKRADMKIIKNPVAFVYNEMTEAVKANNGYCPCAIEKTEDTRCPCREFREQQTEGECRCGRFVKVEEQT